MRGIGYQHIATILSIVSYWIIDLPLAYILLFVYDFDFMGIWIAFPIGNFVLLTGYILIILTAPWSELAQLASEETNSLLISEDSIWIGRHKVKLKTSLKEACILELEKMEYLIELKTNDFK